MSKKLASPTECDHIGIRICDTGYWFAGKRRDIGLRCEDCGTEWDVQIKQGFAGATIKLRSGRESSK